LDSSIGFRLIVVLRGGAGGRHIFGPWVTQATLNKVAKDGTLVFGQGFPLFKDGLHDPRMDRSPYGRKPIKTAVNFGLIRIPGVDQFRQSAGFFRLAAAKLFEVDLKAFGTGLELWVGGDMSGNAAGWGLGVHLVSIDDCSNQPDIESHRNCEAQHKESMSHLAVSLSDGSDITGKIVETCQRTGAKVLLKDIKALEADGGPVLGLSPE
jgi:hypothetical protein